MQKTRKYDTRSEAGQLAVYERPKMVSLSEESLLGELAPVHGGPSPNQIPPDA